MPFYVFNMEGLASLRVNSCSVIENEAFAHTLALAVRYTRSKLPVEWRPSLQFIRKHLLDREDIEALRSPLTGVWGTYKCFPGGRKPWV
jgi:hypothetical protein